MSESGKTKSIFTTVFDVLKGKQVEDALRESEEKFKTICSSAKDAIIMIDNEGIITYLNESAQKMFGYTEDEALGKDAHKLFAPKRYHKKISGTFKAFQYSGAGKVVAKTLEFNAIRKNGEEFPMEISVSSVKIKDKWHAIGTIRDITERKEAEGLLKNIAMGVTGTSSDELLRSLVKYLAIVLKADFAFIGKLNKSENKVETVSVFGNGKILDNFEYDLAGTPCEQVMTGGTCFYSSDVQKKFPDNRLLVELGIEAYKGASLVDSKGECFGVMGALNITPLEDTDIDDPKLNIFAARAATELERMRAEKALFESEAKLRVLFETAPNGVYEVDLDGKITFVSPAYEKITGYKKDYLIGMPVWNLMLPAEQKDSLPVYLKYLVDKQPLPKPYVTKNKRKDGSVIDIQIDWTYKRGKKGEVTGFVCILSDITERVRAEEEKENLWKQLLESQKLESVGRLAGGMAHDFNNILTTIIGYSELVIEDIEKGLPVEKKIKRINSVAKKASVLTNQLLAFSKRQVLEKKACNLNTIINNMKEMLIRILGEDIVLNLYTDSSINNIMADLSQIEQIVMNLTVNSRDAMPNGGSLIVMTKNVELTGDDVKDIDGVSFGQYVLLSVEDTGIGMDEGMREKMFEPFFTSKVKEVSSGLGLSTVLGIVKQHNGFIRVVSAPDKGTEFKIYLPVTARQVEKPDIETRGERRGGDETILIAEDNYSIRKLFADIVKPLGYDVLEAGNAKEAMEVMKKHKKKIDLLLADVVMPGENGWVLYKKMKKQIPDLKVVFTSGYVENPIVLNKIEKKNMPFIKKPLSPHDLGNIIRRVLDE